MSRLKDINGFDVNEFLLEVQHGDIPNAKVVWKFGRNEVVGTTETDLWAGGAAGTAYQFLSAAGVVTIASDNAADTSIDIKIEGLDANYNEIAETLTTNTSDGTTPVVGTTEFLRVNRAYNNNGTDLTGNITGTIGGNAVLYVPAGVQQTLQSIYTIPAGYTGYLFTGMATTSKGKDAQIFFKFRLKDKVFRTAETFGIYQTTYEGKRPYIPFPEKTDLKVSAISSSASTDVSSEFGILIIKD